MSYNFGRKILAYAIVVLMLLSNVFAYSASAARAAEPVQADDLFISEYVEGSSNNKAIELFNGTGTGIDLDGYSLELYANGSTSNPYTVQLSGTLANGDVYVIAHPEAAEAIQKVADRTDGSVINFNGDDVVVLKHGNTVVDSIGQIRIRPDEQWGTGDTSTKDHSLVRNETVTSGDTDPEDGFDPSAEWTGYPKDTFSNLGKHGTDGNGDPTDPEQPAEGTIADARTKLGQTVTVTGVVTVDNAAIGGGKLSTFIQDDTAGINIFAFETEGFPDLKEGQKIKVTGKVQSYKGLLEIAPESADDVTVLSENNTLPEATAVTLAGLNDAATGEAEEGRLVKVSGYVRSKPAESAGGGYNVSIIDRDFNGTTIRVMEGTGAIDSIEEGKWYDFVGILGQYEDAYQVLPRKAADIALSAEQPEPPSQAGEYVSTVASVVDGDTIHLKTPVLGTTTVRYLNIDTPETYHTPKNEADENQKRHGEAAKAYLNELLKPGDEVVVKVGEETTDDYGRLLAQVVRKSDNLNTNLEMVKKGYASTYFIWPVEDQADYDTFQDAVRQAKDAGVGIWNPEDPLAELPFVFRAREQGKGLLRYVGNSDSKKYVVPAEWASVPVEKRVFFASSEEAEANGYTSADGGENDGTVKVQLLGVNDLHGQLDVTGTEEGKHYGRADYLAAYLREREATNPNSLLVHAGDMVGGSPPLSALLQDEPTVEVMEALGFDVGTVGNHEFDEGVDEMLRMINGGEHPNGTPGYDGMNFPVVAANVEYKDTGKLVLPPYAVKEVGGEKIGFIGVATVHTPGMIIAKGNENVRFTDEASAINKYVPELKKKGVESIVVLAHVPGEQSGTGATGDVATMADKVDDEVDVIFAAHNHVKLNAVVDGKLIVQAWEYGKAFSDVDLEIDPETNDIVAKKAEIVDVAQEGVNPDPEIQSILDKYEEQIGPKLNEVVGTAAIDLEGGYAQKGEVGDNPLGNLIADGMLKAMNSDFALMNGGGIRDNLNAGPITWNELFTIQPFGNTLVKLEMTGAGLREVLNAQFSQYGPDVSVGGFTYTWTVSGDEYGHVVDLFLPDGSKIDPDKTYTVTVNNYMYPHSEDQYRLNEFGKNPIQGPVDLDATIAYIRSFEGPVTYAAEKRISEIAYVPIESVALDRKTANLKVGESVQLQATVAPENATDADDFTWTSSDESIAAVDATGKVTAKKEGTATITVATVNGKKATAIITVTKGVIADTDDTENNGSTDQDKGQDTENDGELPEETETEQDTGTGDGSEGADENSQHTDRGDELPDTATDNYDLIVAGTLIVLVGSMLLLIRRRKSGSI